jgi:hypothetical protein
VGGLVGVSLAGWNAEVSAATAPSVSINRARNQGDVVYAGSATIDDANLNGFGGLIGSTLRGTKITQSVNYGTITAANVDYCVLGCGGLIGSAGQYYVTYFDTGHRAAAPASNSIYLADNVNYGRVTAYDSAGGMIGEVESPFVQVYSVINFGEVVGYLRNIGGIFGYIMNVPAMRINANLINLVNSGTVRLTTTTAADSGGIFEKPSSNPAEVLTMSAFLNLSRVSRIASALVTNLYTSVTSTNFYHWNGTSGDIATYSQFPDSTTGANRNGVGVGCETFTDPDWWTGTMSFNQTPGWVVSGASAGYLPYHPNIPYRDDASKSTPFSCLNTLITDDLPSGQLGVYSGGVDDQVLPYLTQGAAGSQTSAHYYSANAYSLLDRTITYTASSSNSGQYFTLSLNDHSGLAAQTFNTLTSPELDGTYSYTDAATPRKSDTAVFYALPDSASNPDATGTLRTIFDNRLLIDWDTRCERKMTAGIKFTAGTAADQHEIATLNDLTCMRDLVNRDETYTGSTTPAATTHYRDGRVWKLTANI